MRARLWMLWTALGALAVAGYYLMPDGVAGSVVYDAIGLTSVAVMLAGVRVHRPARPGMWYLFAAGTALWTLGDTVYSVYADILDQPPFPSAADVLYMAAYPLLIGGLTVLVRRGSARRDRAGLLDAAIIATGIGLLFWTFVITPVARHEAVSLAARLIGVSYPLGDIVMFVMMVRLFTGVRAWPVSLRLLIPAIVLLFGADTAFSVLTAHSADDASNLLNLGWPLSYVLWAASALHPSMRVLTEPAPAREPRVGRVRFAFLASSALLAPVLMIVEELTAADRVERTAIAIGAGVLFLLVVARMSGLVRQVRVQSDQLRDLAMRDELTGLANRRAFEQHIRAAVADDRLDHVALIDLDDFKAVNDRLGHGVGDELLMAVARRLTGAVRPTDVVARLGGDEFALLLLDADRPAADLVLRRVAASFERSVSAGGHELLVAASLGVADDEDVTDAFELLRRADVAMYEAKEHRHGQVRYRADLDERASEDAELGAELRAALDEGQFQLVYQPIVELPAGHTVAVEALVRWCHPVRGMISPAAFIPSTERNGLIVELGRWILVEACRQLVQWRRELGGGAPRKVSVNVSARQLAEPDFPAVVAAALAATGLDAGSLAIEVTETAVFNSARALETLHAVHALGVGIALDDFGTGHSSLGLLQTVPVDILKVDKSFIDNITEHGRHAVIATALINVSDGLNLIAVAEGVETAEQAAELTRLGYRFAQGYRYGRPTAAPLLSYAWAASQPVRVSDAA